MNLSKTKKQLLTLAILFVIVYVAFSSRLGTMSSPLILDYDPWWFYRYAKNLLENNLILPKWDLLSYFPPGRPVISTQGWEYTMIFFYKILSIFSKITFMDAVKLSSPIMVGLSAIPAYFLGKKLSNEWGGFATAIFITLSPTFIGVSMAGYSDTDVVVVFWTLISILSIFLALKKRKIPYIITAIILSLVFIYNWWFGWYLFIFLIMFIPFFLIFRIIEDMRENGLKINLRKIFNDLKILLIPLFVIIIILNVLTYFLHLGTIFSVLMAGLGFLGGQGLLVNVSVAELQPINIFTREGFMSIAGRAGLTPVLIMLIGLPFLVLYNLYRKKHSSFEEIFLFLWAAGTFYLILHGIRFSLLFSCVVAISGGYVIGNLIKLLSNVNIFYRSTVFGLILFMILMFVSDAMMYVSQASGMEVSQNWIDMMDWLKKNADPKALVATWWDPGHILAGYTGLRVHADGAHCGPDECVPYNHNVRIQDMGKIMSTSNENEAISILKKYRQLTPEQCQEVKQKFGNIVPDEACKPISEMYFISSNDLIGKFTWMNYFGGYRAPIKSNEDFQANPGVCCASTPKTEPGQISCGEFASQGNGVWVWCPWIFSYSEVKQDQDGNPVYIYDYSGLKIAIIQKGNSFIPIYNNRFVINHLTLFPQGSSTPQEIDLTKLNTTLERVDGSIWIDPSFRNLIYFAPSIKDSVFTKTFFYDGEGLKHFKLVYSNPETKLYKVIFD